MFKRLFATAILALVLSLGATETQAQVTVNFSIFQNSLSPHGNWRSHPRYGQVWNYNDASFRPYYSNGHWEYTNYGWAWVSDFDWGWAPFHYGRWEQDPEYGWIWIPGYEWASAWVGWSEYDGYYGWAPLGYGMNLNISFGSIGYDRWTFIPRGNICDRDVYRHYVNPGPRYNFHNAVVINNYYEGNGGRFNRGPQRQDVERYTHNTINERRVEYRQRDFRDNNNRDDNWRNNSSNDQANDINRRNDNDRRNDNRPQDRDNNNTPRIDNGNPTNDNRRNDNPQQNRDNNAARDKANEENRRNNDNRWQNRDNNTPGNGQVRPQEQTVPAIDRNPQNSNDAWKNRQGNGNDNRSRRNDPSNNNQQPVRTPSTQPAREWPRQQQPQQQPQPQRQQPQPQRQQQVERPQRQFPAQSTDNNRQGQGRQNANNGNGNGRNGGGRHGN